MPHGIGFPQRNKETEWNNQPLYFKRRVRNLGKKTSK